MNGFRTYAFLLVLATTACATERIKGYEGSDLLDDRLVILKCSGACTEVDGRLLKPQADASGGITGLGRRFTGEVTLLPGTHEIEYGYWWPKGSNIAFWEFRWGFQPIYATVDLEAGHFYEVVYDSEMVSYWGRRYRYTGYIQDLANGAILAKWSCMKVEGRRCYSFELTNSSHQSTIK